MVNMHVKCVQQDELLAVFFIFLLYFVSENYILDLQVPFNPSYVST